MNAYRVLIARTDERTVSSIKNVLEGEGCRVSVGEAIPEGGCDIVIGPASTAALAGKSAFVEVLPAGMEEGDAPFFIHSPVVPAEVSAVVRCAGRTASSGDAAGVDAVLSLFPYVAVRTDGAGLITGVNAAAELHAGRSAAHLVGENFSSVFVLSSLSGGEKVEHPRELLSSGDAEYVLTAPKSSRVVRCHAGILRNGNGVESCFVILEDRDSARECQMRLRRLTAAVENIECGVVVTRCCGPDAFPDIVFCNSSFEKLSGWVAKECLGRPLSILETTPHEVFWDEMLGAVRGGGAWAGEGMTRTRMGHDFLASWSATPILDPRGQCEGYAFALRDLTHTRRMEESLRQSQKIESVGRLATGIAHDFNNLLSVINSYCDLQILKLEEDTPAMKYAQQIRAAGRKGVDLVSQLMTFSRKDRPNPTLLDLSQVVEEVKGMLRRVIREDIEMETRYGENLAKIRADQGQIEQALLNLCVNARDAIPGSGTITIEVVSRDYDRPVTLGRETIRKGRYVVLSVTDTGCGMDEETQKRIFDPFFTTKEIGKGTGLGLATVHGIVKQYGGCVAVHSRPGEGARFELIFPESGQSQPVCKGSLGGGSEAPTGHEKVFIVEDDETFLDCVCALLRLHGYSVYSASEGAAAVEMLSRIDFDVDLLISDLVLPKLSGREVAARLLEKNPKAKVLFMTGYDDQLDTFYSLPSDATIMEKPFPLNSMLVKVRTLLDEGGRAR